MSDPLTTGEFLLAEKLLRTLHLSVPERRTLPGGRIAFSALLAAAERILESGETLPPGWSPHSAYDGVIIQKTADGYLLHERFEIGVMRFSELQTQRVSTLSTLCCVTSNGSVNTA